MSEILVYTRTFSPVHTMPHYEYTRYDFAETIFVFSPATNINIYNRYNTFDDLPVRARAG